MITYLEAQAVRHHGLAVFDAGIHELFDPAALYAHDVIVMGALVDLKHRHAVLEMMPRHKARRLELREHAIDRGEPDVLVGFEQAPVDVLGGKVPRHAAFQQLENLEPRQRDFQAGLAKILAFHQMLSSMMRAIIAQATAMRLSQNRHFRRAPLLMLAVPLLLAGCVYRMNIQQGNYLESKTIDQVQTGMTRSQVRYLLGTPMAPDAFDHDRWDYVYYLKKGRLKAPEQRHLVVKFEDDKVTVVDRQAMPSGSAITMPDPEQPVPKTTDVPPSDPAATQPRNPSGTQPGSPQPQAPQIPPEPPPEPDK